jgi:serine/threonine protein kinase
MKRARREEEEKTPGPDEDPLDLYGHCRQVSSYQKLNQIGAGTYGTVYRAVDRESGRMVALKRVILHNEKQDGFPLTSLREIAALKKLSHPNCVKLLVSTALLQHGRKTRDS